MAQRVTSEIHKTAPKAKFTELNNLSRGAKILFATDDFFAAAENLLKETPPEWKEGIYDDMGKWMDGWETRRKRIPGHDWCIIKLPFASVVHGIDADTSYFTGNFTPKISIQAAQLSLKEESLIPPRRGGNNNAATHEELEQIAKIQSEKWKTLVPITKLDAGYEDTCHSLIPIDSREPWSHIRLNYFPDGGVARLRIFGQVQRSLQDVKSFGNENNGTWDLVGMDNGGICIGFSNAHYGHPRNMILQHPIPNTGDGWETARRLDRPEIISVDKSGLLESPGSEWAAFKLGFPGKVVKVEVDTSCFKGNYPDSCKIEACFLASANDEKLTRDKENGSWKTLVPLNKLGPNKKHFFNVENGVGDKISHVRITIAPDGGVARFRVWGIPAEN